MRALRWTVATGAMIALMVGIALIVAFVLGHGSALGLVSGATTSVTAVLVLAAFGPAGRAVTADYDEEAGREFRAELERMLERVRPRRLDATRSSLAGEAGTFLLAHDRHPGWDVDVVVGLDEIIVSAAGAHEHFLSDWIDPDAEAPHAARAVEFIAAIMRGRVEVERAYRGPFLTRINHYRVTGRPEYSVRTVLLTGAQLLVFLRRRIERERPEFGAEA
jgi:hypothetical protein